MLVSVRMGEGLELLEQERVLENALDGLDEVGLERG